jgi:hypothetical protein
MNAGGATRSLAMTMMRAAWQRQGVGQGYVAGAFCFQAVSQSAISIRLSLERLITG